jgi:hypothetical protein
MITKNNLKTALLFNNSNIGSFIDAPCYVHDRSEGVIAKMIGVILHNEELYSIIKYERAGDTIQTIITKLNLELFSVKDLNILEKNIDKMISYDFGCNFSEYDINVVNKFIKGID